MKRSPLIIKSTIYSFISQAYLILLFVATFSFPAYALDPITVEGTFYMSGSSTTVSGSMTVSSSSNRVLVVCYSQDGGDPPFDSVFPSSVTFNGSSFSTAVQQRKGSFYDAAGVYYLVNPDTGAHTLSVTFSKNSASITAVELSGAYQGAPTSTDGDQCFGSCTSLTSNLTTLNDNDLLLACATNTGGDGFDAVGGQTLLHTKTSPAHGLYSKQVSSSGSNTIQVTDSSSSTDQFVSAAAAFRVFDPDPEYTIDSDSTDWDVAGSWVENEVPPSSARAVGNSSSGNINIPNNTTINHLELTGYTADITLEGSFTVSGTLGITGTLTGDGYAYVGSDTRGTQRTITVNGTILSSSGFVGFEDILGVGSASWDLSGTDRDVADWGGNSGITFPTAQNVYRVQGSNDANDTGAYWFTDQSAGTPSPVLPMGHHVAVGGTFTMAEVGVRYTVDYDRMGNIDYTWLSRKPQNQWNGNASYYGDFIMNSNFNGWDYINNNWAWRADGNKEMRCRRQDCVIKTPALHFDGNTGGQVNFDMINGTYTWSDYYAGGYSDNIVVTSGTLIFGPTFYGQTVTFRSDSGLSRKIVFNDNKFTFHTLDFSDSTNLTFDAGTSSLRSYNCGATIDGGSGVTFYDLIISDIGRECQTSTTGTQTILGSNTYNSLTIRAGRKVAFGGSSTQTIGKLLTTSKLSDGSNDKYSYRYRKDHIIRPVTITSTNTNAVNIVLSEMPEIDNAIISYTNCSPSQYCYAGKNSTDAGNNTGWTFEYPPPSNIGATFR